MKKVEWALPILQKSQKANRINNLWMTKKYNFYAMKKAVQLSSTFFPKRYSSS